MCEMRIICIKRQIGNPFMVQSRIGKPHSDIKVKRTVVRWHVNIKYCDCRAVAVLFSTRIVPWWQFYNNQKMLLCLTEWKHSPLFSWIVPHTEVNKQIRKIYNRVLGKIFWPRRKINYKTKIVVICTLGQIWGWLNDRGRGGGGKQHDSARRK